MVNLFFWFSEKAGRWYKCQDEDSCLVKADQGFEVRKMVYKSMPKRFRNNPKSSKKKKKKKNTNHRPRWW